MQSTDATNPLLYAERHPSERRWFIWLAFTFPAFAGFLFGYDIGAASSCIISMKTFLPIDEILSATLTSSSLMGATLGSMLVFACFMSASHSDGGASSW